MPLDARIVADRLSACPDVSGLHSGPLGRIVTPTPAGPVVGILVDSAMIVLGIVVGPEVDAVHVAAGVRARMSAVVHGLPISLSIRKLAA